MWWHNGGPPKEVSLIKVVKCHVHCDYKQKIVTDQKVMWKWEFCVKMTELQNEILLL